MVARNLNRLNSRRFVREQIMLYLSHRPFPDFSQPQKETASEIREPSFQIHETELSAKTGCHRTVDGHRRKGVSTRPQD
jgi:hypothetical protein